MTEVQTSFPFTLPVGYTDGEGIVHREGIMRLATGADEILPLRDPRVQANPAYLTFIVLARVVTLLGTLESITPKVMEDLFAPDLGHLQQLYDLANGTGRFTVPAVCPRCEHEFETPLESPGKSASTPPTASVTR